MWQLPEPGDIVWCRAPGRPRDIPVSKPRPALVVSVKEYADGAVISVTYGTSQKLDRMVTGEFALSQRENKTAFELAGLSYDTKFDMRKILDLPWSEAFFAVPDNPKYGQMPKMGSLHPSLVNAVKTAAKTAKKS